MKNQDTLDDCVCECEKKPVVPVLPKAGWAPSILQKSGPVIDAPERFKWLGSWISIKDLEKIWFDSIQFYQLGFFD